MDKKILLRSLAFIPVLGIVLSGIAQAGYYQDVVDPKRYFHFFGSAIVQIFSIIYLLIY